MACMATDQNRSVHCRCVETPEAKKINAVHVHCPCEVCEGKAVLPMTAWRHRQRTKRARLEEPDRSSEYDAAQTQTLQDVAGHVSEIPTIVHCSASYWEPPSCQLGNLADADPLVIGDADLVNDDADSNANDNNDLDDDDRDSDGSSDNEEQDMQRFIQDAVLKLVELKGEHGFSIEAFERLLEWGRDLHCHNNEEFGPYWPSKWENVKTLLQRIGYQDAKLYWICLDSSHPCQYSRMESKDEQCQYCGKSGTIPYYYLSLHDKVKRWCSSPVMCKMSTAHWEEREHWLPVEQREGWGCMTKKEIWDGKRFAELSYFWDPTQEWTLPTRCPHEGCHAVISADELLAAPELDERREVTCSKCFNPFDAEIKTTHGDPRNIAYIAHWDGWQPFSTSVRGCGAVEMSIATMSKVDRCRTEEVYVVGFVPSYLLPKKRPISLDPFLEPLITDIEDGFINGITVNYSIPLCGQPAGETTLRHLILCWAGDHSGQCEVGKFVKCGKCGCRRCKAESTYIPEASHYYYTGFRKQARFPAEEKHVINSKDLVKEIEEEERITVRQRKAKECGYTGLSILQRLYPLYGFEYDHDLVYDELHGISLNVVKHAITVLKEDQQDIDWEEVDRRLDRIPWTHEFKASRIPRGINKRMGFWKAEEYSRFAFPASEVAFDGLLAGDQAEEWRCVSRIVEFLQNHARNGWSEEDSNTFHEMVIRYAVLLEEHYGPSACVITLHNLIHFKDDVRRFGGLDNYSCWVQERAVRRYIQQSNNHKNVECTFAAAELRREVIKARKEVEFQGPTADKIDLEKLWAKSLEQAKRLYKSNGALCHLADGGILVGGLHALTLDAMDCQIIAELSDVDIADVNCNSSLCRSLWKAKHAYGGLLYRVKEYVVIIKPGEGETIAVLDAFYTVCVSGIYKSFLKIRIFEHIGFTRQGLQLVQMTNDLLVAPISSLSRKVMLFAYNEHDVQVGGQHYAVIDFMRRIFPVTAGTVLVPYYPVINDMVDVKGGPLEIWRAQVKEFSLRRQVVQGRFFVERQNMWVPEGTRTQEIHFRSILGVANGHWVNRYNSWQEA